MMTESVIPGDVMTSIGETSVSRGAKTAMDVVSQTESVMLGVCTIIGEKIVL
jgi:hypothetical protein